MDPIEKPEDGEIERLLDEEVSKRLERVQAMAEELRVSECLDSVVIITTYNSHGFTQYATGAAGNSFACAASAAKYALDKKEEWKS